MVGTELMVSATAHPQTDGNGEDKSFDHLKFPPQLSFNDKLQCVDRFRKNNKIVCPCYNHNYEADDDDCYGSIVFGLLSHVSSIITISG
jgi:hypothetical protein